MLVLWSPILQTDNRKSAENATTFLSEPRVEHFWDLWGYAMNHYSQQLRLPEREAWDIYLIYKAGPQWSGTPPLPSFWLQNRGLDIGAKYSPQILKVELERLIR